MSFRLLIVFSALMLGLALASNAKLPQQSLTPLADAAAAQNEAERDKRGLDLGLLLRNVLLKSADLSSYKANVSRAKATLVTPTTRAPTTRAPTTRRPTTHKPIPFVPLQKPFPPFGFGYGKFPNKNCTFCFGPSGYGGHGPAFGPFGKPAHFHYPDYDYDYDYNADAAPQPQADTTTTTASPPPQNPPQHPKLFPYGPPPSGPFYGSPSGRFNKQGGHVYFENAYNAQRAPAAGNVQNNNNNQQPQAPTFPLNAQQQLSNKLLYRFAQQDDTYSKDGAAATANNANNTNNNVNDNSNDNEVQYLKINPNANDDADNDYDNDNNNNNDNNNSNDNNNNNDNVNNNVNVYDNVYNNVNVYDRVNKKNYNNAKIFKNKIKNQDYNDYNDAEDNDDTNAGVFSNTPPPPLPLPPINAQHNDINNVDPATNYNLDVPQPFYITADRDTYELPNAFALQQQQRAEPYHYFVLGPKQLPALAQQQQPDEIEAPQVNTPQQQQFQIAHNDAAANENYDTSGLTFGDTQTTYKDDSRYTTYTQKHNN